MQEIGSIADPEVVKNAEALPCSIASGMEVIVECIDGTWKYYKFWSWDQRRGFCRIQIGTTVWDWEEVPAKRVRLVAKKLVEKGIGNVDTSFLDSRDRFLIFKK